MSSLPYVDAVGVVAKVGMCLTLVMNSFLIYITIYHIKNIKGVYKYLIILLALLGNIFSVMEIFVHPFMHSYNASYVYFSTGDVFGASKAVKTALILIYSEIYLLIICVLTIQFVNRYFLISNSEWMGSFSGWGINWWLLYLLLFTTIWACSGYVCLPDDCSIEYLRDEMLAEYNQSSEDVAGFFIVAFEKKSGQGKTLRANSMMCVSGYSMGLGIQYIIIIFCGVKIHTNIRKNLVMASSKKGKIQSQLFKTLVFQITAPSLFYHAPAFAMFMVPFFDWKLSVPSGIMISLFNIYPAIDTMILMFMVTEYHQIIGKMVENGLSAALEWVRKMTSRTAGSEISPTTEP